MALAKSVLSSIRDEEIQALLQKRGKSYVDWIKDEINNPAKIPVEESAERKNSLQQTDLLRPFYLTIARFGLKWGYLIARLFLKPEDLPTEFTTPDEDNQQEDNSDKHVIIVGAGISGMVAAYELTRAGYKVTILEMSQRYGGRVKTFTEKDGFDRGLHSDAGAMRLPQTPDANRPVKDMIHYLTDFYAMKRFQIKPVPFSNYDKDAYYRFYGNTTKISEWDLDPKFSEYWPGWDDKIKKEHLDITTINDYYDQTVGLVIQLLKNRLEGIPEWDKAAQAEQWTKWTNNWCQFSFGSFLRSKLAGIKTVLEYDDKLKRDDPTLNQLHKYLPWPEAAITAYKVFNYTLNEDVSLATEVQEKMGDWWTNNMHTLEGGMHALSDAFAGQGGVEKLIVYNRMVTKVEYIWTSNEVKTVKVSGVITSSGEPFEIEGRSVILSPPLHVIRGIQIENGIPGKPFPLDFQKAIEDISYSPSTKIMLQYKKQFWNTDGANITGGFSKTNMPIGQLHYPTERKLVHEGGKEVYVEASAGPDQKGILMVYTWKAEALLWGALTEQQAIMLAVNQIEEIHPGTKDLFEVGKRQPWADDPTTLGAFAMLRPREYISVMYLMQHSWRNVYFAGEAISFANGWIQGALESGLRAAYQVYADDQKPQKLQPSFGEQAKK